MTRVLTAIRRVWDRRWDWHVRITLGVYCVRNIPVLPILDIEFKRGEEPFDRPWGG